MIIEAKPLHKKKKRLAKQNSKREKEQQQNQGNQTVSRLILKWNLTLRPPWAEYTLKCETMRDSLTWLFMIQASFRNKATSG